MWCIGSCLLRLLVHLVGCSVGLLIGHGCLVELIGLLFGLWVSCVRWFGRVCWFIAWLEKWSVIWMAACLIT